MAYVWRDGRWREPATNKPMPMPKRVGVCAPRVQSDIADYRSPVDGRLIGSRSAKREDLKRNDCIECDPKPPDKRGCINPRFANKRGLPLRAEVQS